MATPINSIDANTDNFASWLDITNEMAQTFTSFAVTANSSEGVTGNSTSSVHAKVFGSFIANTIHVRNIITTNTTSYNVALRAIQLDLESSSKLFTNGDLEVKGNIIIDTTSKLRFADRSTTYATTSTKGWLKANSTGYVQFANLAVAEADLDPTEWALSSTIGYAGVSKATYDVICYDSAATKWVRTNIKHLANCEIDTLDLGLIRANTTNLVRVNANVQFGGAVNSLFVSNTLPRVGIGQNITNPQAALHVNGAIYATGDVTGYYTSDQRLKTNITNISDPLEKVRWLRGVCFEWDHSKIADLPSVGPKPTKDVGLLAQDVEKVFPEVVFERDDGYKAVDYSRLVPVLIEAIKELSYRLNIVEAELQDKYHVSGR